MEKTPEQIIEELEKKVAELEGRVPEQQVKLLKDELNLLKLRKKMRDDLISSKSDLNL